MSINKTHNLDYHNGNALRTIQQELMCWEHRPQTL
jgi:hypothetical protein